MAGHPVTERLILPKESDSHIVDIGAGGAGDDQAAAFFQCVVGVVVAQYIVDQNALRPEDRCGIAVHIAAGGISRPVGTVAAHTEYRCVGNSVDAHCSGQSQLLVSAAHTLTGKLYHSLTAGQEGKLPAGACMRFENGGQEAAEDREEEE